MNRGWMADSCTKWLTKVTVQAEEAEGYYMRTAYRMPVKPGEAGTTPTGPSAPVEAMVVKSLIAAPHEGETVKTGPVTVQGVAWSGEAKVVKVEVSVDDGKTWEPVRLLGEDLPYAWRQWQWLWNARIAGPTTILCRAMDSHGDTQPGATPWNPGGFLWNGWDRISVTVVA